MAIRLVFMGAAGVEPEARSLVGPARRLSTNRNDIAPSDDVSGVCLIWSRRRATPWLSARRERRDERTDLRHLSEGLRILVPDAAGSVSKRGAGTVLRAGRLGADVRAGGSTLAARGSKTLGRPDGGDHAPSPGIGRCALPIRDSRRREGLPDPRSAVLRGGPARDRGSLEQLAGEREESIRESAPRRATVQRKDARDRAGRPNLGNR